MIETAEQRISRRLNTQEPRASKCTIAAVQYRLKLLAAAECLTLMAKEMGNACLTAEQLAHNLRRAAEAARSPTPEKEP